MQSLVREPVLRSGWYLSLYPDAGEAGGSFRYAQEPLRAPSGVGDPERAREEAARRARGQVRRFCAANRLNRLGTLTYRGAGCHDPRAIRADLAAFFRRLRSGLGARPLPYLWVPEWHKTDHGLHAHFAVGRYVRKGLINASWPHGFTHIKQLNDLPVGSGPLEEARRAARYLGKYVGKAFDERRVPGLHRYEVAQGFQPKTERLWGRTADAVVTLASERMGTDPSHRWSSEQETDWNRPPAVWVSWAG